MNYLFRPPPNADHRRSMLRGKRLQADYRRSPFEGSIAARGWRYHSDSQVVRALTLAIAAIPFVYYLIVLYSCIRFFRQRPPKPNGFTPPVSNLKPIRGIDPDAYENFASFCRQDYPDYEILFCVDGKDDPAVPILERLAREFPERRIRVLYGSERIASNDKVAKLARLVSEASHEHVVISDSDVRVRPDYLRRVIAPLADSARWRGYLLLRGDGAADAGGLAAIGGHALRFLRRHHRGVAVGRREIRARARPLPPRGRGWRSLAATNPSRTARRTTCWWGA